MQNAQKLSGELKEQVKNDQQETNIQPKWESEDTKKLENVLWVNMV